MIGALLSRIAGWLAPSLWYVVAAAFASALAWGGVMHWQRDTARHETQEVRDAWTLARAQATQAALDAEVKARAKEQADADKLKGVQDAYDALQIDTSKKLAVAAAHSSAALADNGRLRDALATYAAGSGAGAQDTAAAASQRAAALGLFLAEALRLDDETLLAGSECAGAAESAGDAVRAFLKAWPAR